MCRGWRGGLQRQSAALAQLRRRIEALEDFLEHVDVGLHCVGNDGTILWANAAELALMGRGRDAYVGRSIADFYVDRDAAVEVLRRLAAGEVLRDYPAELLAGDGSVRRVLINSSAWLRDGEFVHTRCYTRLAASEQPAVAGSGRALTVIHEGREFVVTGDRFTIGRTATCDLVIRDAVLSRVHCYIERTPDGFLLMDANSACGIEVAGQRVTRHRIADGDVLELCQYRVEFRLR